MADASGDNWKVAGVDTATNPQSIDVSTGLTATESQGTVTLKVADGGIDTTQLAADAVTNAKIEDDAVSLEHLDAGITPSHIVVYAGEFTTLGGDENEAITVTGALATDLVHVNLHTKGATPRTILTASAATNAVNIEMSGDPSTDHVITYTVLRAVA